VFTFRSSAFALVTAAAMTGTASATTINSFLTGTTINGVTLTPAVQSPNLAFTVTLNAGATFTAGANTYNITDIIGFYLLAPGFNDGGQGSLASFGGFDDDSDSRAAGSIYGWHSNPNDGIAAGNSQVFTFPSINYTPYTQIGFHVRLDGFFPGTTGNTGNITGSLTPTPGAAALLGLGGLVTARRRR
jgi:MYXO-CTERM domain-containing protein